MKNKSMSFFQEQFYLKRKAKKLGGILSETGLIVLPDGNII